jgi:acetyl esterase
MNSISSAHSRGALGTPGRQRPMWERDIAELRQEERDQSLAGGGEPEPVASVTQISARGVPAWLYWPEGYRGGVFVWLHGGAWMLGTPVSQDPLARAFANRIGCAVLSVDYRRSPEHRYPAATDDAWNATRWAAGQFGRVAVGGDSAGGNLAAAVALRARDHGLALALQMLVYPVLDGDLDAPYRNDSAKRNSDPVDREALGPSWRESMRYIWQQYVPDQAQRLSPDASPIHASSLAGLAPAMLITAGRDILCAESEEYARRLAEAGVPARLRNYPHASHGFFHLLGAAPDARDAVDTSAEAVRRVLGQDPADKPGDPLRPAEIRTADKRHL